MDTGEPHSAETDLTPELTRRDLLKLGAAATLTASLGVAESLAQPAPATRAPAFFTADEFAIVEELSELIIPTDEHSPGAKAAKVAAYIDFRLAEAWEEKDKAAWKNGIRLVDQLSQTMSKRSLLESSPDERLAVLTRMAQNESKPQKPEELFFVELKAAVVRAYYTSEIGIKQEMEYKGNTYLPEFVGFDVT